MEIAEYSSLEVDPLDPLTFYEDSDSISTSTEATATLIERLQRSPQFVVLGPGGLPQQPQQARPIFLQGNRPIQPIPPIQPIQPIRPLQPAYPLQRPPGQGLIYPYPGRVPQRGTTRIIIKPIVILPVGTGYNNGYNYVPSLYGPSGAYPYPTQGYPTFVTTTQRPIYNYNNYDYNNNYNNYQDYNNYGDGNYGYYG